MCRSIISLSKIAHQLWYDYPFSQKSKITERAVGAEIRSDWEGGCWITFAVGQRGVGSIGRSS